MRRAAPVFVILALGVYALLAAGPWRDRVWDVGHGRDFASFYYAAQVASGDGDPYDVRALGAEARQDGTRSRVHPYFYPPPFLLVFLWVLPLKLGEAFRGWYLAQHLFLLSALLAIWRFKPTSGMALLCAAAAVTFGPVPDNNAMGQVNLLVFAVVVLGVLAMERGRAVLAGGLVGLGCMLKMSPALLVALWAMQGRWRGVAAALGAAALLSLASLPVAGPEIQVRFYTEVLPSFGHGSYHGLTVPITLPANHSIPSLVHEIMGGGPTRLLPGARVVSLAISLGLLILAGWHLRRAPRDPVTALCQAGVVVVLMLVLPLYTYEHHMVWMLLPYGAAAMAAWEGRLGRWGPWLLAAAYIAQAFPLPWLKGLYGSLDALGDLRPLVYYPLREAKFLAALLAGGLCLRGAVVTFRTPGLHRRAASEHRGAPR